MVVDECQGMTDSAQHAKRKNIDLEQAQGLQIVLIPLDDGTIRHCGIFNRDQPCQRTTGDYETANML